MEVHLLPVGLTIWWLAKCMVKKWSYELPILLFLSVFLTRQPNWNSNSTWGKYSNYLFLCFIVIADTQGPAPASTRWTLLLLDFQYILSMYLNRKYSYLKSVRLCANLFIKNLFTTDTQYEPGITVREARELGLIGKGVAPLPREMNFPVPKGHIWHDHYDYIRWEWNWAASFEFHTPLWKILVKPLTGESDFQMD